MGERYKSKTTAAADIYLSADKLLNEYGRDAVAIATMRAEESLGQGDMEGYRTWKRIVLVVDELTACTSDSIQLPH